MFACVESRRTRRRLATEQYNTSLYGPIQYLIRCGQARSGQRNVVKFSTKHDVFGVYDTNPAECFGQLSTAVYFSSAKPSSLEYAVGAFLFFPNHVLLLLFSGSVLASSASLKQSPGWKMFKASTAATITAPSRPMKYLWVLISCPLHPSLSSATRYTQRVKMHSVENERVTRKPLNCHESRSFACLGSSAS